MRFIDTQTERLNAMYSRTTHPTSAQRGMLVKETGLDMTQASLHIFKGTVYGKTSTHTIQRRQHDLKAVASLGACFGIDR